jgi:hypothetical protein
MNSENIAGSIVALTLLFAPAQAQAQASGTLDTKVIEKAIGKSGELKEDVYKISFLRKDLSVTVKGITLKPSFALGTWIAFKQAGSDAVLDGDLVLTEEEVGPVFGKLRKEGIEVSDAPQPSNRGNAPSDVSPHRGQGRCRQNGDAPEGSPEPHGNTDGASKCQGAWSSDDHFW